VGHRQPVTLAEIAVDEFESRAEEAGRHHKHIGEGIDESNIYLSQQPYQPTVHQPIAVGSTIPLFFCHR